MLTLSSTHEYNQHHKFVDTSPLSSRRYCRGREAASEVIQLLLHQNMFQRRTSEQIVDVFCAEVVKDIPLGINLNSGAAFSTHRRMQSSTFRLVRRGQCRVRRHTPRRVEHSVNLSGKAQTVRCLEVYTIPVEILALVSTDCFWTQFRSKPGSGLEGLLLERWFAQEEKMPKQLHMVCDGLARRTQQPSTFCTV